MTNITWKKTSALRPVEHGLVDYIATGFMLRDKEEIPCEIGFTQYISSLDNTGNVVEGGFYYTKATHIFIKAGITASGHHYEDETIEI